MRRRMGEGAKGKWNREHGEWNSELKTTKPERTNHELRTTDYY